MRTHKLAAIGGDGIGSEVISAGLEVLEACAERDGGHEQLREFDAIYLGAVGAPDVPDHITLWGLRLSICQPLDQAIEPLPGLGR